MSELEDLIRQSGMTEEDTRRYLNIPDKLFDQYLANERPLETITAGRMVALINMIYREANDIAYGRKVQDMISLKTIGWPRLAAVVILNMAEEIAAERRRR